MFISSRSGARGLQCLSCFEFYNLSNWKSRSTLGLDAAEITDYIKKGLKYSELNFPQKSKWLHMSISPHPTQSGARAPKNCHFYVDSLYGSIYRNAAKVTEYICINRCFKKKLFNVFNVILFKNNEQRKIQEIEI